MATLSLLLAANVVGLDWLHGQWTGTARIFDLPATVEISVGPTLRDTATVYDYRAEIPAAGDRPAFHFEGRGTYRVTDDGKVIGNWVDSQGNFHPLAGMVEGQTMRIVWGEPRTEVGQSTYTLQPDGTLTVTDSEIAPDGTLRVFSSQSYTRRPR